MLNKMKEKVEGHKRAKWHLKSMDVVRGQAQENRGVPSIVDQMMRAGTQQEADTERKTGERVKVVIQAVHYLARHQMPVRQLGRSLVQFAHQVGGIPGDPLEYGGYTSEHSLRDVTDAISSYYRDKIRKAVGNKAWSVMQAEILRETTTKLQATLSILAVSNMDHHAINFVARYTERVEDVDVIATLD